MAGRSYKESQRLAHELLDRIGATRPEHIDPVMSAKALDIEIAMGGLPGSAARVCRHGSKARIRVSDAAVHPGRRWFSIAHEIGHYLLGHAIASEDLGSAAPSVGCELRSRDEEQAADAFAVAHLMPETMVRSSCVLSPANLYAARQLAELFHVSPVASASRVVDLSDEPCALVYSVGDEIAWMKASKRFPYRLPRATRLGPGTAAANLPRDTATEPPRTINSRAWFPFDTGVTFDVEEHVERVIAPKWGGILSILRIPGGSNRVDAAVATV